MAKKERYISREVAVEAVSLVQQCMDDGFILNGQPSAITEAGRRSSTNPQTVRNRLASAKLYYKLEPVDKKEKAVVPIEEKVRQLLMTRPRTIAELVASTDSDVARVEEAIKTLHEGGTNVHHIGDRWDIPRHTRMGYLTKARVAMTSDDDNCFKFGVVSDNHAGSKYERQDVLEDLFDRFAKAGVEYVFHAGNWIEGESHFNKHDINVRGLEQQCVALAESWPYRPGITTYAVWGDDHEGWYAAREGIDVGAYCEQVFRRTGREDWVDIGYLESHVKLVNAHSGAVAEMNVQHAGGGSAYALSYRPQKIIESLEGGEKPAILLIGHYHKLDPGLVRNVWYLQAGCTQDQTPFMRKKAIEAHVGGCLIECEQDPTTGAIVEFTPRMRRYFNRDFYANPDNRWSKSGPVNKPKRTVMGA